MTVCRCNFDGSGEHLCHGDAYTCKKPAERRFYNLSAAGLAGCQIKVVATETFACDECWAKYETLISAGHHVPPK